ncbi:hypothetical protein SMJ63A_20330 [Stenotrophomonas geniculata]
MCEVKEEVTAVGRRRGTFARKPLFPQRSTSLRLRELPPTQRLGLRTVESHCLGRLDA